MEPLTEQKNKSLVKALLEYLGQSLGTTSIDLYRKVLSNSLDLRTSMHAVSILDEENLKKFYREKDIAQDPQFLSIQDPVTLRSIADVVDGRILILASVYSMPAVVIFDSEYGHWVSDEEQQQQQQQQRQDGEIQGKKCFNFVLVSSRQQRDSVTLCVNKKEHTEDELTYCMIEKKIEAQREECQLTSLLRALCIDTECPATASGSNWTHKDVILNAKTVLENITKTSILIVSCRNKRMLNWSQQLKRKTLRKADVFNPRTFDILLLSLINESHCKTENAVVVMPRLGGGWYVCNRVWKEECVKRFVLNKPKKRPRPTRDMEVPDELVMVYPPKKPKREPSTASKKDECCDVCSGSHLYSKNMSERGPQKLYKKPWDHILLAKACGFYTDEMKLAIQQCHRLSMAFMDIESTTSFLKPGGRERQRPSDLTSERVRDEDHLHTKIQKPLAIGHAGGNAVVPNERDFSSVRLFFRDRRETQMLVNDYAEYITEERAKLEQRKKEMLKPILTRLCEYKKVFLAFWGTEEGGEREKKKLESSWAKSLLGSLQMSLLHLCQTTVIFSFNGSR